MGRIPVVITLAIWAGLGLAQIGAAQTAADPTIHNVTLHEGAGVLTITGTGFGREPAVTVAGQSVTVLSGGTETQIDVLAPTALLTTPGTYRLTVMDPVRQVGDAFVVASHVGVVLSGDVAVTGMRVSETAPAAAGLPVPVAVVTGVPRSVNGPAPMVIEDSGPPYRTALGYQALLNTSGEGNTGIGFQALLFNTTGEHNTASGFLALVGNRTGHRNTALGYAAGYEATTGSYNLFLGAQVVGTSTDTNTIRIGLPYNGVIGQNRTFIAGIHGSQLMGNPVPVFIDANGRLGTVLPPCQPPCAGVSNDPLQHTLRQLADQEATIADLHARLARLEARLAPSAGRK